MSNKTKALIFAALLMAPAVASAAATSNSGNTAFGTFATGIISWITGNLGYLIAIFAFFGSIIMYAFTHKGSVVVIGLIIAVLVGGGPGITRLFFKQGTSGFSTTTTF